MESYNPYVVLGVRPNYSTEQIRQAYLDLIAWYAGSRLDADRVRRITLAYETVLADRVQDGGRTPAGDAAGPIGWVTPMPGGQVPLGFDPVPQVPTSGVWKSALALPEMSTRQQADMRDLATRLLHRNTTLAYLIMVVSSLLACFCIEVLGMWWFVILPLWALGILAGRFFAGSTTVVTPDNLILKTSGVYLYLLKAAGALIASWFVVKLVVAALAAMSSDFAVPELDVGQ